MLAGIAEIPHWDWDFATSRDREIVPCT